MTINFVLLHVCKVQSMIKVKTKEQIEIMYESAQVVSRTLGMLAKEIKPGVTTLYLDKLAEDYIRSQGAKPGFWAYMIFLIRSVWVPMLR